MGIVDHNLTPNETDLLVQIRIYVGAFTLAGNVLMGISIFSSENGINLTLD